jgi:hypothetical protein
MPSDEFDVGMELCGVPSDSIKVAIETEFDETYESSVEAVNDFIVKESGTETPLPFKGAIRSPDDLSIGTEYEVVMEGLESPWIVGKLLKLDCLGYKAKFENNTIIENYLTKEENEMLWVDLSTIGVCCFPNGKWTQSAFIIKK